MSKKDRIKIDDLNSEVSAELSDEDVSKINGGFNTGKSLDETFSVRSKTAGRSRSVDGKSID